MALPEYFTPDQQNQALEALSLWFQADDIASVLLEPHQMTVVTHDLDILGQKRLGPDGMVVSTTTVIPLRF